MYHFGHRSTKNLLELHLDLQRVMLEAIKTYNFSIIKGHRGRTEQNKANDEGKSQLRYPDSKHNKVPSLAVDVMPWPEGFEASHEEWNLMATHILAAATRVRVPVKWGGHWKSLVDKPHFELIL